MQRLVNSAHPSQDASDDIRVKSKSQIVKKSGWEAVVNEKITQLVVDSVMRNLKSAGALRRHVLRDKAVAVAGGCKW